MSWFHGPISPNPSISRKYSALKCFRSHWDLQLSCWKFPLNHLASWCKFGSKLWKNVNFQHFEKILSLKILTFQNEILTFWFLDEQSSYFDMSWWNMIFETWFWPKSQSLTFCVLVDFLSIDSNFNYQSFDL